MMHQGSSQTYREAYHAVHLTEDVARGVVWKVLTEVWSPQARRAFLSRGPIDMYGSKTVSVVFPAYNEDGNIRSAVEDFFISQVVDEVVVVDNNSRDRTAEEATRARARVVKETEQGYGHALRRGLREATGDIIIMSEPDGTFLGRDIFKLLAYADDFDMVCGTRTTQEMIWKGANMGWFLRIGNWLVAKLLQVLYDGPSLSDCGCTLRLIHRPALERFQDELTVGGSHFLPEMVILAFKHKVKVIEVPVNYHGRVGESKITGKLSGTLRTGFRMIGMIVTYKFSSTAERFRPLFGFGRMGPTSEGLGDGRMGVAQHPITTQFGGPDDRYTRAGSASDR